MTFAIQLSGFSILFSFTLTRSSSRNFWSFLTYSVNFSRVYHPDLYLFIWMSSRQVANSFTEVGSYLEGDAATDAVSFFFSKAAGLEPPRLSFGFFIWTGFFCCGGTSTFCESSIIYCSVVFYSSFFSSEASSSSAPMLNWNFFRIAAMPPLGLSLTCFWERGPLSSAF